MNKLRRFLLLGSILIAWVLPFGLLTPGATMAAVDLQTNLNKAGETGFGQTNDSPVVRAGLSGLIGSYVTVFLGFTGSLAFLVFLYGGFLWLTAQGNDEQVATAKKYLFNGTAGVVIIVLAYSISYYITNVLYRAAR